MSKKGEHVWEVVRIKQSDSGTNQSIGGKIVESFKKHPLLWSLGIGAVVTGVGGIAMYAALPTLTKIGLALL